MKEMINFLRVLLAVGVTGAMGTLIGGAIWIEMFGVNVELIVNFLRPMLTIAMALVGLWVILEMFASDSK